MDVPGVSSWGKGLTWHLDHGTLRGLCPRDQPCTSKLWGLLVALSLS